MKIEDFLSASDVAIDVRVSDKAGLLRELAARAASALDLAVGRVIVNTAPVRSLRFAAVIVPLRASTKPREMARPKPVPART